MKMTIDVLDRWEKVNNKKDLEKTQRLKVFGGWLVLTTIKSKVNVTYSIYSDSFSNDTVYVISQSFVPDPNHEWEI